MSATDSTFWDQYKDPRWQKKRLEIFTRDKWTCCWCCATDRPLQVHHLLYKRDARPWDYPDCFLETLCADCHDLATMETLRLKAAVAYLGASGVARVIGYAEGLLRLGRGVDVGDITDPTMAQGVADALRIPVKEVMTLPTGYRWKKARS